MMWLFAILAFISGFVVGGLVVVWMLDRWVRSRVDAGSRC